MPKESDFIVIEEREQDTPVEMVLQEAQWAVADELSQAGLDSSVVEE